jgi:hypothetical protein
MRIRIPNIGFSHLSPQYTMSLTLVINLELLTSSRISKDSLYFLKGVGGLYIKKYCAIMKKHGQLKKVFTCEYS